MKNNLFTSRYYHTMCLEDLSGTQNILGVYKSSSMPITAIGGFLHVWRERELSKKKKQNTYFYSSGDSLYQT